MMVSCSRHSRIVALLVASLLLVACSEPVLEGPNYPADSAPFIAAGYDGSVADLDLQHRLILIGDAGLYLDNDPTLKALGDWAAATPNSTVLFLGDNIYDDGLIEEERVEAERILSQQLAATPVPKIVLPGNHDWGMDPAQQNIAAIRNQQAFIDAWSQGNARFAPRDGCIGPEVIELAAATDNQPAIVMVLLDPTPFLTPRLRELCATDVSDKQHFAALDEILQSYSDDHVIVASHYPMVTGGPHGGLSYGFVGDIIVGFYGWMMGGLGNTYEPNYADWISRVEQVFKRNPPLIYAAGHDHSLQILESAGEVGAHIVSGAGAPERVSTVTSIPATAFAHAAPGFIVVDIGMRAGQPAVVLRVVENGFQEPVYEMDVLRP